MGKNKEALVSALPITLIVYLMALLPWFDFSGTELITFTIGAVLRDGFGVVALVAMAPLITIHAEKEILMMVVEKDIRDNVLNALYKQMGMQKKAQGIVFSLPVSDVAGLVQIPQETEEAK